MTSSASQSSSEAWQLAVQHYLSSLPNGQKAGFKIPANASTCLDIITQAQGRKRGFTRLMDLLKPLIDPLKRFEAAIDVIMQTHGAIASPIWGPLRMAITMASDHFKTLESLAMILYKVVGSLERFTNYETLFKTNPAVQKTIGALYSDLIDFSTRVVQFHSRSSLRTIVSSFDKDFRDVSEHIDFHSAEIDWVANAANIEESQRARQLETEFRQGKEVQSCVYCLLSTVQIIPSMAFNQYATYQSMKLRHLSVQVRNNIQRWLSPSNVQDDLHRHQLECMPGSCDWILESPQAQDFFNAKHSTTMRILGRPGSGKTVLTSFLINHLADQNETNVLYFFCKAGETEKQETTHALRTLLSQLLRIDEALYHDVEPLYTSSGRATADSYVEVHAALLLALSKTIRTNFILIDALDESQDADDLIQALLEVQRVAGGRIAMLFTSRQMHLSFSFDEDLLFNSDTSKQPIQKYVDHRVLQMKTLSDGVLGLIVVRQITRAADGLWLYARLMLDEIERLPSAALIQRHLRNVPHGLLQLYTQLLRSKESTFTVMDLKFAQQVLLWFDLSDYCSAFQPRSYVDYETLVLTLQKINFGQPLFNPAELVSKLCSPLIRVDDVKQIEGMPVIHGYQISPTHHTADQYIRESQKLPAVSLPLLLRPRRLRQLHRCNTSIWYFTVCEVSATHLVNLRNDPERGTYGSYFEMAYGLWNALHLIRLPVDLDKDEINEASTLLQDIITFISCEQCLRWVETAIIINYVGKWSKLLLNTETGLDIAKENVDLTSISAFQTYQKARLTFLADYAYILQMTGPDRCYLESPPIIPDGFHTRLLAVRMLEIGQKWQEVHR